MVAVTRDEGMLAEFIYVDVEVAGRGEIQLQRIEYRIGSKRLEYAHVLHEGKIPSCGDSRNTTTTMRYNSTTMPPFYTRLRRRLIRFLQFIVRGVTSQATLSPTTR